MTCQELCLDAVMTEGERWETFCSACTCYGFVWLFAWREALFRFREWQWRLWSRDNVIEFACDNVTILEAWNVALLSSDVGWWYSRGTETAVSVPGMLAVKQVLHWRLVMCHKLSVLIEVSSCLAVLPRWCFFEATYRHCRQSRVVLSEYMCIRSRLANRPGMAGIVPELTHGVPWPGRGSFCPGNVKIDHWAWNMAVH